MIFSRKWLIFLVLMLASVWAAGLAIFGLEIDWSWTLTGTLVFAGLICLGSYGGRGGLETETHHGILYPGPRSEDDTLWSGIKLYLILIGIIGALASAMGLFLLYLKSVSRS